MTAVELVSRNSLLAVDCYSPGGLQQLVLCSWVHGLLGLMFIKVKCNYTKIKYSKSGKCRVDGHSDPLCACICTVVVTARTSCWPGSLWTPEVSSPSTLLVFTVLKQTQGQRCDQGTCKQDDCVLS